MSKHESYLDCPAKLGAAIVRLDMTEGRLTPPISVWSWSLPGSFAGAMKLLPIATITAVHLFYSSTAH